MPNEPPKYFYLDKSLYNSEQNGGTGIFYEFSNWRIIEIQKLINELQNLPKGNGSSVIRDVKPGL